MRPSLSIVQPDNANRSIKEMIENIARALVDEPDAVSVSQISGTHSLIFELSVAKEDIGKIIGKQGRTAGAMRIIINAVSAKTKMHSVLEILD